MKSLFFRRENSINKVKANFKCSYGLKFLKLIESKFEKKNL